MTILPRLWSSPFLFIAPVWVVASMLLLPVLTLMIYAMQGGIIELLPLFSHYLMNTLMLLLGVGIISVLLGAGLALLVSFYRFPYVDFFGWALFLPFSIPTYIIAYRMQQFDDSTHAYLPEFRSLTGLILLFSFVLYPYIYLIVRTSLQRQSAVIIDAARVMGLSYFRSLVKVALPLCWPSLLAGLSLVLLEVLNEYGAVALSSVPTLSVGLIDLWWSLGEVNAAAQLAMLTLCFVLICAALERFGRGHRQFYQHYHGKKLSPPTLTGLRAYVAVLLCVIPIMLGFIIPVFLLLSDILNIDKAMWLATMKPALNSILLGISTAFICVLLGIVATHILRNRYQSGMMVRVMQFGYAIPGILLAIGLLLGMSQLANLLNYLFDSAVLLSGSILLMLIAYICRFNHIAVATLDSNMQKLSPRLDDAAATLGRKKTNILKNIHLPLLDKGMQAIFLLVMVDVLKELPASLILRPFNFDTLAINVFEYASDERIEQAAPGALMIICAGLFPVIYLSRMIGKVES